MRFEPSLVAKKGNLLADFTGMVGKPAKNPHEMIVLITEMDKKIKTIEDVIDGDLDEQFKMSVLIGIMDPMTRQHTAMDLEHDYPDMKNNCLKFANNMAINKSHSNKKNDDDKMNIDSVEEKGEEEPDVESLSALQRQNLQCYTCKGWGHFGRDCPSKSDGQPPKGKGKGKDKGAGGKEKNNGCAICFAPDHWKNECPQNQDKGKGKAYGKGKGYQGGKGKGKSPGVRSFQEYLDQAWDQYEGVQKLCGLSTVSSVRLPQSDMDGADPVPAPPVPVKAPISRKKRNRIKLKNSFQVLCCESDVSEAPCSHDLEDPEDDGPPVLEDSDTDEDKKFENSDEDSDDDDDQTHSKFWDIVKKRDERMKWMIETAIEKSNVEIRRHSMKQNFYGAEWKTVSRKTRTTTVQAGMGKLLKPQVTEVAMPPEVVMGRICPLKAIEPKEIMAVTDNDGWMTIDLAVDSAATETVLNEDMLEGIETTIGEANKRGVEYEVANGIRIPNLGEKVFKGHSDDGIIKSLTAQVCDVNKALLSVRRIVENGHKVVFDKSGSYIEDKSSGEKMWLREEGGMYMLKMWVRTPVKGPF
jgi:hypothetical protein